MKMGRGLHELDLPLSSSDMAYVGQGAVKGGESETVERPTDLPLAPGAAVVPPPGSGSSESDWRSTWTNWEVVRASWAPWGMSGNQGDLGNPGIGRKRTLSESSCISNVSITPRKRRLSETVCENVTEQLKLTTPVRKYQVNPKALQSARSNARQLGKQMVDTENGLDLGRLLELKYSSSDETLSKESRGCRSIRHGRGWCKFGDNCVVRREGSLTENLVHQETQGEGKKSEKRDRTEEEDETENKKKKTSRLGVESKFARRVSGTEVIVGTVGPAVKEDIAQVSKDF